ITIVAKGRGRGSHSPSLLAWDQERSGSIYGGVVARKSRISKGCHNGRHVHRAKPNIREKRRVESCLQTLREGDRELHIGVVLLVNRLQDGCVVRRVRGIRGKTGSRGGVTGQNRQLVVVDTHLLPVGYGRRGHKAIRSVLILRMVLSCFIKG